MEGVGNMGLEDRNCPPGFDFHCGRTAATDERFNLPARTVSWSFMQIERPGMDGIIQI